MLLSLSLFVLSVVYEYSEIFCVCVCVCVESHMYSLHRCQTRLENAKIHWTSLILHLPSAALAQVTALARYEPETDKGGLSIIAGYSDGAVRIWDVGTYQMKAEVPTASQKGVSAIATCSEEHIALVGTKDGKVIVWDTIGDVIQWRLQGHRAEITGLALISASQVISIMLHFDVQCSGRKDRKEKKRKERKRTPSLSLNMCMCVNVDVEIRRDRQKN